MEFLVQILVDFLSFFSSFVRSADSKCSTFLSVLFLSGVMRGQFVSR